LEISRLRGPGDDTEPAVAVGVERPAVPELNPTGCHQRDRRRRDRSLQRGPRHPLQQGSEPAAIERSNGSSDPGADAAAGAGGGYPAQEVLLGRRHRNHAGLLIVHGRAPFILWPILWPILCKEDDAMSLPVTRPGQRSSSGSEGAGASGPPGRASTSETRPRCCSFLGLLTARTVWTESTMSSETTKTRPPPGSRKSAPGCPLISASRPVRPSESTLLRRPS